MVVMDKDKNEIERLIEEEAFLIKHSGETPEIAYHSSLYFLFEDLDGPRLKMEDVDLLPLKRAVFERYKKILFRDLDPRNRDRRIYRGVARSIANWHRLKGYSQREGFDIKRVRDETRKRLLSFLEIEHEDVKSGARKLSINCTYEELLDFAMEIGLSEKEIPAGIKRLCQEP